MDTTSRLISFDENGVCNFCKEYEKELHDTVFRFTPDQHKKMLGEKLASIKAEGSENKYDCILGISGGMDSSYLCVLAKQWGLRPLVVHFDNGWDSDLAVSNINKIITKLGLDLYTHVINWEQFKDLQIAYFKASVIDIEVPTDQLIFAVLFEVAEKMKIKTIVSGSNLFTEQILPYDWAFHHKRDLTNLRNIHRQYGKVSIRDFPTLSKRQFEGYKRKGYKIITVFEHLPFDYEEMKRTLREEFDYAFYECKHFESVFTRFYQGYILPRKWNIDKRKAHLSCLIMAGAIRRGEAVEELKKPAYSPQQQIEDKQYLLKKWDMTEEEFEDILRKPPVDQDSYGFDKQSPFKAIGKKVELIYKYQILKRLGLEHRINTGGTNQ
jgi:N-acetyl sugar amidotransferase